MNQSSEFPPPTDEPTPPDGNGREEGPVGSDGSGSPEAPAPRPPLRRRRSQWVQAGIEAFRSVAVVIVLFLVVRAFLVEAFKIPTSSMEGTLLAGDFLLVNKAVYGAEIPGVRISLPALAEPERGDVIVFHPPHEPTKHYVKRVVGLPGDTLEMRGKRLFVNGLESDEPYVVHQDRGGDAVHPGMSWQAHFLRDGPRPGRYRPTRDNWGPIVVPEHRFFVLGDNRDNSEDSRYWGFVQRDDVKGRPWLVYYSSEPGAMTGLSWLREIRWNRIGGRIR